MNELIVNIIGFTAGTLMAITMVPQIIQSLKTKSVKDISLWMLVIYVTSSCLWMIYGILIKSLPVAITDGFAFCVSTIQLIIKIKYTKIE
jgi:MtN3 and saliva related transmembrane protein